MGVSCDNRYTHMKIRQCNILSQTKGYHVFGAHFWAHLCGCTVGSYASLFVCDLTKNTLPKFISPKVFRLGSRNLVRGWTWMTPRLTLKVNVIGQRSRSSSQKTWFDASFDRLTGNLWGQESHGSRSKVTWIKVKGRPWRSRSNVKVTRSKIWFHIMQVDSCQRQVAFFSSCYFNHFD